MPLQKSLVQKQQQVMQRTNRTTIRVVFNAFRPPPSAAARCQRDSLSAERLRPGSAVATHRRRHPTTRPQAPKHPTRRQLLRLLLHKLVGSTLPRMYGLGVPALIALLLGQVRRRRPIVRGIHVHDDARHRHGDYHSWQRPLSMSRRRPSSSASRSAACSS